MIVERIPLEAISRHLEGKNIIRNNQHGFDRDKSSLSNLIAFCDELPGPVSHWERTVDDTRLYFSKFMSKSAIASL